MMPWKALSFQGQLTKAESTFNMMKETGCLPDVITYTAMIHAYSIVGNIFPLSVTRIKVGKRILLTGY